MADQTVARVKTVTLTANTNLSVELTDSDRLAELVHHNDTTDVVYFGVYPTDPADVLTGGGADDEEPLLPGERLPIQLARARGQSAYVELRSTGTPTVSVVLRKSQT